MKIGTITFHSSYNHGSCLQAYALQTFISSEICKKCEYNIINLRTPIQKEMYKSLFEKRGIKNRIKQALSISDKKKLSKKADSYEKFIKNRLICTKEYSSLDELKHAKLDYDYYISGSDQLWNLAARDFDWANYLEFTNSKNKISYAASFGPLKNKWDKDTLERIKKDLSEYQAISVREEGSADMVEDLLGYRPLVHIDPTLLLDSTEWNKLAQDKPLLEKDYIFLYDVKNKKIAYEIARKVSKKLKMPVVIVASNFKNKLIYPEFIKKYDAGPEEFLNLIKNAKLVLSSSFHGTVFSVIFRKPFFSIDGAKDLRISNLLKKLGLEDRYITKDTTENQIKQAFTIDYSSTDYALEEEKKRAKEYLSKSLKR